MHKTLHMQLATWVSILQTSFKHNYSPQVFPLLWINNFWPILFMMVKQALHTASSALCCYGCCDGDSLVDCVGREGKVTMYERGEEESHINRTIGFQRRLLYVTSQFCISGRLNRNTNTSCFHALSKGGNQELSRFLSFLWRLLVLRVGNIQDI